ncbi:hypothetical protein MHBO_001417 [Bonamia ostreae]|uniref:RING-type domain-containing protein n=1 Tax=Bonamia ostreae TaxID=126728 RepID=A0ABV2AJI0_9EUKA
MLYAIYLKIREMLVERSMADHEETGSDVSVSSMLFELQEENFEALKNSRCIICLENYVMNTIICCLACEHLFHEKCILKWLRFNKTCPICNQHFRYGETLMKPSSKEINHFTKKYGDIVEKEGVKEKKEKSVQTAKTRELIKEDGEQEKIRYLPVGKKIDKNSIDIINELMVRKVILMAHRK